MISILIRSLYVILVVAPLAWLGWGVIGALVAGDPACLELMLPTGRRLGLLLSSVAYASAVASAVTIVGFLGAVTLLTGRLARYPIVRWTPLILAVLPPWVHALAWSSTATWLSSVGARCGLIGPPSSGLSLSIWVQSMALLPFGVGLSLLGLLRLPDDAVAAARLSRPSVAVLTRVVLPLVSPHLVTTACLVFVMTLGDYSVPSLFAVTTYPLEVFAEFSSGNDATRAMASAVPLLLVAVAAVLALHGALRLIGQPGGDSREARFEAWSWPPCFDAIRRFTLGILALQLFVPLAALLVGSGSIARISASVVEAGPDLVFSLLIALAAALLSVPLAHSVAVRLVESNRPSHLWWLLAVAPLAVPAPLAGIALVPAGLALPEMLARGALLPTAAVLVRFTPFAILLLVAHLHREDRANLDAAEVFQPTVAAGWLRIRLQVLAPTFAAAAGLMFALSLGELGATLLIVPPGRSTLAIRIYNYLHYGASESVAGLCLVTVIGASLAGSVAVALLRRTR